MSSQVLRTERVDLIHLDLLGPKNGPTEEVDESHAYDRCLVGMLAPPGTRLGEGQDDELGAIGEHDQGGQSGTPESGTSRAESS